MRKLLVLLLFALTLNMGLNAQKKRIEISEHRYWTIRANYNKVINLENNDTTYMLFICFQNAKYTHISNVCCISFYSQKELNEFLKDIKIALPEMSSKTNINWDRELYGLSVYDFVNSLYLIESPSEGTGYTRLSKKGVEKLIYWVETIQIGKG